MSWYTSGICLYYNSIFENISLTILRIFYGLPLAMAQSWLIFLEESATKQKSESHFHMVTRPWEDVNMQQLRKGKETVEKEEFKLSAGP